MPYLRPRLSRLWHTHAHTDSRIATISTGINTAASTPPSSLSPSSSSPTNSDYHSNLSSVSMSASTDFHGDNANSSSTHVPPNNNANDTNLGNTIINSSKNAIMINNFNDTTNTNANNANLAPASPDDLSSYRHRPNSQFSFQNFRPNQISSSSSPLSSSPLSSQFSNSSLNLTCGSAASNTQQQQQQLLSATYPESYSSSYSSPSPLSSSTATIQPQSQNQVQKQFHSQATSVSNETRNSTGNNVATAGSSANPSQNIQGLTPNVYINGLPPHFPDESLYLMTREFGTVRSVRTFTRHVGERLSGYGFVLFETIGSAEKCINSLRRFRNLHPSFSKQVHKIPGTQFNHSSPLIASANLPSMESFNTNTSSVPASQSCASSISSGTSFFSGTNSAIVTSTDENVLSGASVGGGGSSVAGSEDRDAEKAVFRAKMERLKDANSTNLYIEGLPLSIDENTLAALVSPHQIKSSRLFQTKLSDPPRIIAFVRLVLNFFKFF